MCTAVSSSCSHSRQTVLRSWSRTWTVFFSWTVRSDMAHLISFPLRWRIDLCEGVAQSFNQAFAVPQSRSMFQQFLMLLSDSLFNCVSSCQLISQIGSGPQKDLSASSLASWFAFSSPWYIKSWPQRINVSNEYTLNFFTRLITASFFAVAAAVARVNEELAHGSVYGLLAALRNPALGVDPDLLTEFAAPLYWEEMVADRLDCGHDLNLQVINFFLSHTGWFKKDFTTLKVFMY